MGLTVVPGNMIEDGTITDSNFTNTTITSADMAVDPRDADNLSSGSVPAAQLGNVPDTDLTPIKNDLAMVGFKIAANGSLSQYNLLDQIVDDYQTNSLIAAAYTRHTVTTPGTTSWTVPAGVTSIDYLVVAGGGGGGGSNSWQCAGGGAGGYRTGTLEVIAGSSHTITVGAGGAGGIHNTDQGRGQNGGNSVFSTITSSGGGGGGAGWSTSGSFLLRGKDGGSGGGGSPTDQGNPPAPNATSPVPGGLGNSGNYSPIEGYPGQDGGNAGVGAAGGGGAGGSGTNASAGTNPGGPGVANDISGSSVTYATGGTGRGSVVGTANTGNGGDGRDGTSGQAGGSGIVILRYKVSSSTNAYYDTTNKRYTGVMEAQGGVKTTVGDYTVHSFLGSGSFEVGVAGNVDYLVVAGGGGGGGSISWQSGGGGAGGVRTGTSLAVTAQTYAVTIGKGGAGGVARVNGANHTWNNTSGLGVNGGNSVFSTISATGGGGGGGGYSQTPYIKDGSDGGSGGGGGAVYVGAGGGGDGGAGNAGSYSPVEGYAGQDAGDNGHEAAGGGGAGGLAITPWSYPPAGNAGGPGISNSYRTGSAQTYGVGGWAYWSSGGPGDKGDQANTGGGGTSGDGRAGFYGGTGIVVLRYTGSLGTVNDMTLVPDTAFTAQSAPTKGDIVMTYSNQAGTASINSDVTAEYSADNGSTWTTMTLVSQGTVGDGSQTLLSAHDVALTSTSGTSMKYRIKTLNQTASKITRVHAVSLGWS